eukprot:TRINITY_DN4440_c0_g1_i2.p1 TRINITY_DN4440_c0_g1~~TRINITY_DN4440_c0_g1_i2.p1  ORF type:complete len:295 (+),score=34.63 TRINITY_DN4440_c0_g1_i2:45-929(+)
MPVFTQRLLVMIVLVGSMAEQLQDEIVPEGLDDDSCHPPAVSGSKLLQSKVQSSASATWLGRRRRRSGRRRQLDSSPGKNGEANMQMCQGDCDKDSDCAGDLVCFKRSGYRAVPGCPGNGKSGWDYCVSTTTTTTTTEMATAVTAAGCTDVDPDCSSKDWYKGPGDCRPDGVNIPARIWIAQKCQASCGGCTTTTTTPCTDVDPDCSSKDWYKGPGDCRPDGVNIPARIWIAQRCKASCGGCTTTTTTPCTDVDPDCSSKDWYKGPGDCRPDGVNIPARIWIAQKCKASCGRCG